MIEEEMMTKGAFGWQTLRTGFCVAHGHFSLPYTVINFKISAPESSAPFVATETSNRICFCFIQVAIEALFFRDPVNTAVVAA